MKLEVVVLAVADVARAKDFYKALGWREDADFAAGEGFRVVQLTPPGSQRRGTRMQATYGSAADLAAALRRAAAAHGRHEEEIGQAGPDWPDWYARYMVDEQAGRPRPAGPGAST